MRYARFITRVPLWLSKHLWVWPLLGAAMLGAVGLWSRSRVEGATRAELAARLETLLKADVAALRLWFSEQQADAKSFASDVRIREAIVELAAMARESNASPAALAESGAARTLELNLMPLLVSQHYLDYVVIGTDKRILALPRRQPGSQLGSRDFDRFIEKALDGRLVVSRPFVWELNPNRPGVGITMFVASPVLDSSGQVVAALALRMKPEAEFSRVFSVAHMGNTGEAYAFDLRGVMLTASRFDAELKMLGLIPNVPGARAILNLKLLDPGKELQPGVEPAKPRADLPLTQMAQAALRGEDGVNVEGYRNYRGTKVVGAWMWLPEYGMGVATEAAASEAFQTLYLVRQAFVVLFLLLVLSAAGIFTFTLLVERLAASVRRSALSARRLGQYVLVQEIGRGASGMVYRARHSLLRRPVAVKLLSPEMTNENTIASFEHEVQMTSQLTHPNTIAIYDYGRTPEGLFYYAMEYLSGIDLDQLVRQFGPQPEGRVIHILRQVCGSLAEAHRAGLIHRDIKPANIILTRRGGVGDTVKVLDFGLVKARHVKASGKPRGEAVVGTPHFIPPEAVGQPDSVDARSDLYSLGAVAYWLVSGKTLFGSDEVEALLRRQVEDQPPPPSKWLGRPVSPDLEELIMRCLAKSPAERPATAETLERALGECKAAGAWTLAQAQEWWQAHMADTDLLPASMMAEKTIVIARRS